MQTSSDQDPTKEEDDDDEEEEDSLVHKMAAAEARESNKMAADAAIPEVCDKTNAGFEMKIDDIPYVDERDDLDETGDVYTRTDCAMINESAAKGPANARNKLERMASRASFIIESALWVQRLNSKDSDRMDKLKSERSAKEKSTIARKESKFKNERKLRNTESPPRMSNKDKKLLKMILVIFSSFLVCYLPITVTKTFKNAIDWRGLNIAGYILIYLTTCINPVVYVVMSSEYRSAYKNLLLCRNDPAGRNGARKL